MKSSRRNFIKTVGAGGAGIAIGTPMLVTGCKSASVVPTYDEQVLFIGDDIAVCETIYGKVKGYILRGIYYFLGIPYGADTSGANRFMPPQKPKPWNNIFPAVWWGNSAPQIMEGRYANRYQSFVDHWNYDDVSEDCLRLNVFTPAIKDGKKRPVLVWLHGGGFTTGNGIEQDGYNGENFCRKGDVVFVSVNHRLGPLGFTNLASVGGEKYSASGNVGMLDLIAALEWVRDNISNFGGDPGNVTIMGQSGGGAKVTTLTAMPSAKGLFHKAVVLSGAGLKTGEKEYAEKLGEAVLKEAGLKPGEINKLHEMPWQEYYQLANRASAKLAQEAGTATPGIRRGFSPCADGVIIPQHPYYPEATPLASEIPMIICSTMNEMSPSRDDASLENVTLDEVKEKIRERAGFSAGFGDKAGEVVDAYARAFPDKKPVEIWSMIMGNRQSVVALADAKSKQPSPVYVAWFCWQPPLFDNRMRAFHCSDICFWFYNTDVMLTHTGGGSRPRKLSEKMSGALLQFMKTGNPDNGGLPAWPKYTSTNGEVMVLDDISEVKNDPDREARKSLPPLT
ncbi:MAG TPA: carboxylesterase family protein [Bacteroidales bacterium]|nr:carboxylesterase/lipase family protein [Bacteroidales bacterium]HCI55762.1 carboxylesterase [Bacteroidales bacterium]HQG53773.1 carboxylesterase family protein [Bacteroidales bacterium]HQJ21473.1 carboxylesterase family protein [Bacteroidales bacterium]HRC89575.1 carboxylesterase family protein [Bacteroidales bacterium]